MDKNNRILFIAPLPPPIHGSSMVSQQIKNSQLINEVFDCDWVNLSTCRRMTEAGDFSVAKIWRVASSLFKTFCFLITKNYDLCYFAIACHGGGFIKDAPFVLLCKLFRKKILIHQHNKGMSEDVNRWPFRWLLPMVYRDATVILLSWHLYPDIQKIVPKEKVFILPNGIRVDYNISKTLNELRAEHQAPRLLFLSNLMVSKGVLVLLDALEILSKKGIAFHCDFVGGETNEIDAKRFAKEVDRRGLNQVVEYHGRKEGSEKNMFFARSDIFVFPTYNECFPLVILEAMSYYLPCITTNAGGIEDIIEDGVNGIIVRLEGQRPRADKIAHSIERLINNKELCESMGRMGRKKLEDLFTEDSFESKLSNYLQECCLSS